MRDLGALSVILGIEVIRDRPSCRLFLSQRKYVQDVLAHFGQVNSRPVVTPLKKGAPLTKDDCPTSQEDLAYMSSVPYLSAIGSLMYLSLIHI